MNVGIILFAIGAGIMVFGLWVNLTGRYILSWVFFLAGLAFMLLSRLFIKRRPGKPSVDNSELYRSR